VIAGGVIIFTAHKLLFAGTKPTEVLMALETNSSIVSEFGTIRTGNLIPSPGTEINWSATWGESNKTTSGTYFFELYGDKGHGIVKVLWSQETGRPVEVTSTTLQGAINP
jgi:hypothetical protein